jgi:hypothetical protein
MWKALFLALGLSSCILGLEFLFIDKAVLHAKHESNSTFLGPLDPGGRNRELVPADWAPWSLLSGGLVTMLYSCTLPQRSKKE